MKWHSQDSDDEHHLCLDTNPLQIMLGVQDFGAISFKSRDSLWGGDWYYPTFEGDETGSKRVSHGLGLSQVLQF